MKISALVHSRKLSSSEILFPLETHSPSIDSNSVSKNAITFRRYFLVGYVALGYEMCAEYTYPESEGITAGILNVANNVYGIVLILIMGRLLEVYGDIPVHVGLCIALLIGFIMTLLTKDVQRRQDARNSVHYVGVEQSDKSNERNRLEKNWFALNYRVLTWHVVSTFEYGGGRDVARLL